MLPRKMLFIQGNTKADKLFWPIHQQGILNFSNCSLTSLDSNSYIYIYNKYGPAWIVNKACEQSLSVAEISHLVTVR